MNSKLRVAVVGLVLTILIANDSHADTENPKAIFGPAVTAVVVAADLDLSGKDLRGCKYTTKLLRQTRDYMSKRFTGTFGPTNNIDFSDLFFYRCEITATPGVRLDGFRIRECTFRFSRTSPKQVIYSTKSYQAGRLTGIRFVSTREHK